MSATDRFFSAIADRNVQAVKTALKEGADIHALSKEGQGALHATVSVEKTLSEPLLDLLIASGADINQKNAFGQTPMDLALNSPYQVSFGRPVDENGNAIGKERPPETRFGPSPHDVLALYKRNAKATDQDSKIAEIRECLCQAGDPNPPPLGQIAELLASTRNPKSVPPLDAPAYDNNADDPFLAFATSYNFVNAVAHGFGYYQKSPVLQMIGNIQENSWEEYAAKAPDNLAHVKQSVSDMAHEFRKQVIGSALLRGLDENSVKQVNQDVLYNLIYGSYCDLLIENRRAEQLLEMAESYHRHITTLQDKLNLRIDGLEWSSLLKGETCLHPQVAGLQDYTIEHLTTGRELADEGKRLNHCVGGYASSCMMGNSHIFSIRDPQGVSISTFEIAIQKPGDAREREYRHVTVPGAEQDTIFVLRQHYGHGNGTPPVEGTDILEWFIGQVEKGAISLQTDSRTWGAHGENTAWKDASPLEQHLFHYKSDMTHDRQQRLFDLMVGTAKDVPSIRSGRKNYLVAPRFRHMAVEDFLEESGLNAKIKAMCERENNLSKRHLKGTKLVYTPPRHEAGQDLWQRRIDRKTAPEQHGRG